jgi:hypothetical protein
MPWCGAKHRSSNLEANRLIPVINVHVDSLKLNWQQHTVVGDKVPNLLQFLHALLQPVLRRYDVFVVVDRGHLD